MKELIAVVGFSIYAFIFSYIALFIINFITAVRTSEKEELNGLDSTLHGEDAYIDY